MKRQAPKRTSKPKVQNALDVRPQEIQNVLPKEIQNESNRMVRNGLTEAIVGFNPSGLPWSVMLSQVDTLFKNNRWYLVSNMRQLLSEIYVEIGLVQTVIDVPVDDGLRGGVLIKSKILDEEEIKELSISLDRDDDVNTVGQALKWNRLYGGAGVLIMTDQDPQIPLQIDRIRKGSPLEFRAVDMWELFWDKQNTEGYNPELQDQNFEYYSYYSKKLHKSRVMRMKGLTAPSFVRPRLRGWGFSVVEALVRSINQYLKATDLGFEVLDEFKLDIFKVKNLVSTLNSPGGEETVRRRIALANYQKNYQNALTMDAEDDYIQKQLSWTGLSDAMDGIRMQVAADMRMPITKLFGTSASKGYATDQNDMENYNSMVESQVRAKAKYDILRIVEIKCQHLFGYIPDDLEIEFKPLRTLTAEQEEIVKTGKFTRVLQARQAGEITTYEFRDACNKDGLLPVLLDNADGELNPDDPEVEELVTEGSKDPEAETDSDDPGANKEDTRKPELAKPKGDVD